MTPDEIVAAVNAYEQDSSGQHRSHTVQTRRVTKALTLIGIPRSDFSARTERNHHGEYGDCLGSLRTDSAQAKALENAETLVRCGVSVHVIHRSDDAKPPIVFTSSSYPFEIRHYHPG